MGTTFYRGANPKSIFVYRRAGGFEATEAPTRAHSSAQPSPVRAEFKWNGRKSEKNEISLFPFFRGLAGMGEGGRARLVGEPSRAAAAAPIQKRRIKLSSVRTNFHPLEIGIPGNNFIECFKLVSLRRPTAALLSTRRRPPNLRTCEAHKTPLF
jgi:hypothetical protein